MFTKQWRSHGGAKAPSFTCPSDLHVPQISDCLKKKTFKPLSHFRVIGKIQIIARGRSYVAPKNVRKTLGASLSPSFKALVACVLCLRVASAIAKQPRPVLSMKTRKFQQRINRFPALKIACALLLNLFKMAIPVQL